MSKPDKSKSKADSEKQKSGSRSSLEIEWERLKALIPGVGKVNRPVEEVENDIFRLVDGKRNCEDIVAAQDLSTDSAVLIFLRLERDGIIHCVEPSEKLRDLKFEKHEREKELEFVKREKSRLLDRITGLNGEMLHIRFHNKGLMQTLSSLNKKIGLIDQNIRVQSGRHKEAMDAVDQLVECKMDMQKQKKDMDNSFGVINEEVLFLKDEKWSAMKSIRELETRIEEVLEKKNSLAPKMSAYRSVIREAFKTLRVARDRADTILKEI